MKFVGDDSQYDEIKKTLGGLQKVSAPANFEADLMRRINSGKFDAEEKTFWQKLLLPSRWIPSAAIAAALVTLLVVIPSGQSMEDNPLLAPPRVREDVIASTQTLPPVRTKEHLKKESVSKKPEVKKEPFFKDDKPTQYASNNIQQNDSEESNLGITITGPEAAATPGNPSIVGFSNDGYPISKRGLEYRQQFLTREERAQLQMLKKKMEEMIREMNR